MNFWDKIKALFKKKKKVKKKEGKEEIYETQTSPDQINQLRKEFRDAFYDLKGKLDKAEDTIEELKQENKKLKEKQYEKEKEEAFEKEEKIKGREKKNKIPLFFSGKQKPFLVSAYDNHDFFVDEEGNEYKIWKGIMFEKSKNGTQFRFLLTNESEKDEEDKTVKVPYNRAIPIEYFPHMFDTDTYVSDLRLGKVPVYLTKEGEYVQPEMQVSERETEEAQENIKYGPEGMKIKKELDYINNQLKQYKEILENKNPPEEKEEEMKEAVEQLEEQKEAREKELKRVEKEGSSNEDVGEMMNIDLRTVLENANPKVKQLVLGLYNRYMKNQSQAKNAAVRARKHLMAKREAELTATAAETSYEDASATISELTSEVSKLASELNANISSELRARMESSSIEEQLDATKEIASGLRDRLSEEGRSSKEKAKREMEDELDFLTDKMRGGGSVEEE